MRYFLTLLLAFSVGMAANAKDNDMKEIKYRGGVIAFFIPKNWVEHYEPDGGGMFYEDAPNTGTLRVDVITTKSTKTLVSDAAYIELGSMKSVKPETIKRLPNGNAIVTWVEHTAEGGQAITLFWWHVANPVPPNHLRLANFSYTVLASQEDSALTKSHIRMLTSSITNAEFHSTIGE